MSTPEDVPKELVVDAKPAPGDSSDGGGSGMRSVVIPVLACGLIAKFVSLPLAGGLLALSMVYLIVMRKPGEGRHVLLVDGAFVEVRREKRKDPLARFALNDLLDVTLEKKSEQVGNRSMERARIVLDRREGPVFVPEERITGIEAQEWQGKLRVFLRKHGWLPTDER